MHIHLPIVTTSSLQSGPHGVVRNMLGFNIVVSLFELY